MCERKKYVENSQMNITSFCLCVCLSSYDISVCLQVWPFHSADVFVLCLPVWLSDKHEHNHTACVSLSLPHTKRRISCESQFDWSLCPHEFMWIVNPFGLIQIISDCAFSLPQNSTFSSLFFFFLSIFLTCSFWLVLFFHWSGQRSPTMNSIGEQHCS